MYVIDYYGREPSKLNCKKVRVGEGGRGSKIEQDETVNSDLKKFKIYE